MELPHIGQTCVICNRNDYLPFKCNHCDKIVCVDHKTNHGFECPLNKGSFNVDTNALPPSASLKKACQYCKKITLKLELVECNQCNRNHCLYHRHQVQHECFKLAENVEKRQKQDKEKSERQKEALERLKQTTQAKQGKNPVATTPVTSGQISTQLLIKDPKKQALERRVRTMTIKSTARGPPDILTEDKVFFQVKYQHQPESNLSKASLDNKTLPFYTTSKHTIGRMIDWTANEFGLINKNHVASADELIFAVVLGSRNDQSPFQRLESHYEFKHYLDANELESGDQLILKYVPRVK